MLKEFKFIYFYISERRRRSKAAPSLELKMCTFAESNSPTVPSVTHAAHYKVVHAQFEIDLKTTRRPARGSKLHY